MLVDACKVTGVFLFFFCLFFVFFQEEEQNFEKEGTKEIERIRCVFSSTKIYRKIKFQSKVIK